MYLNLILLFVIILVLDISWLSVMMPLFYKKKLNGIIDKFRTLSALMFYIVYTLGVYTFVVTPIKILNFDHLQTFVLGGFFGLVCFSTYDLTNRTSISKWPLSVTIVDITWGICLTGTASILFNLFELPILSLFA
jgi:uncharacterized membrane protein